MEELFRCHGFKELRLFIYTETVYTNSTMENADIKTWLQKMPLLERFQWKNIYSEECARLMTLDHLVYFAFFSPRLKELTIALSLMDLGKQLKSSMVECQTTLSAGTIPFPSLRWLTLLIHDLDPFQSTCRSPSPGCANSRIRYPECLHQAE
ncbi:hypothetical protein FRC03_007938 [Tulasnella sp. 419]|nr:hypothetical protein FRC03_007938 [Tulasnella sp. 419]